MAMHPSFPSSPYEILNPEYRWFPADETLRESSYEKLLPPLVDKIRKEVQQWRNEGYEGASVTSKALLRWWFETEHIIPKADGNLEPFRYYFAQREAVETVIWLYEVAEAKDKYDLIRYDASGTVSSNMFDEEWLRLVIKMATGSGKTKVMSLLVTWCFFHKCYEPDSLLATNFLVIAPNIIVLDRLRADFDGLKIFFNDPLLPDNGYEARTGRTISSLPCTYRTTFPSSGKPATSSSPIFTASIQVTRSNRISMTTTSKTTSSQTPNRKNHRLQSRPRCHRQGNQRTCRHQRRSPSHTRQPSLMVQIHSGYT